MSVADEITRIQTAKDNIVTSIKNKGVSVPDNTLISDLPGYIDSISTSASVSNEGFYNITSTNPYFKISLPKKPKLFFAWNMSSTVRDSAIYACFYRGSSNFNTYLKYASDRNDLAEYQYSTDITYTGGNMELAPPTINDEFAGGLWKYYYMY